ncbi:MAG: class II aldolase/adducin family protein [Deltaproteobacteria bacterium]|jgi:L-fuculose-phosphate aldolase|nr:class II aldolase/adducin family protein [Deltaproteobacteria bacterium]
MLDAIKEEVLRISRLAEESGLCHHGGGNFSMIDRDLNQLAITPHAESRFSFEAKDLIVMDLDGKILENQKNLSPSSETEMHLALLRARPEINAVCHTHARQSSTFAVLNKPVKPVLCEAFMYGGFCRVAPFELPGTKELALSAVKGIEGTQAVLLQKHGLLTIGTNIYEAYLKSVYVEDVAEVCLRAAAIVGYDNVEAFSEEEIDYMMRKLGIVG